MRMFGGLPKAYAFGTEQGEEWPSPAWPSTLGRGGFMAKARKGTEGTKGTKGRKGVVGGGLGLVEVVEAELAAGGVGVFAAGASKHRLDAVFHEDIEEHEEGFFGGGLEVGSVVDG